MRTEAAEPLSQTVSPLREFCACSAQLQVVKTQERANGAFLKEPLMAATRTVPRSQLMPCTQPSGVC